MTEAELIGAQAAFMQLSSTATVTYLSLVSGYLITSYLAGTKLSSVQVLIVSILFTVTSLLSAFGSALYFYRGLQYAAKLQSINNESFSQFMFWFWLCTLTSGILASLYFMYSTRRIQK